MNSKYAQAKGNKALQYTTEGVSHFKRVNPSCQFNGDLQRTTYTGTDGLASIYIDRVQGVIARSVSNHNMTKCYAHLWSQLPK